MMDSACTSPRMPVYARNAVASSQPLAVQSGIRALQDKGNAIDAALACAITLTVVEPTSNGLGSDAFAMVFDNEQLYGYNSSGRAPGRWQFTQFAGLERMPTLGWQSVTVPGAVALWCELSERHGRLPFARLFDDAIHYARHGFKVSPITAQAWHKAETRYADFKEFNRVFLPGGRAPSAGETFCNQDLAATLQQIADSHGQAFYEGPLAQSISTYAAEQGALLDSLDLKSHYVESVTPLSINYYGVSLHELPPNGQGLAALLALGMLQKRNIQQYPPDSIDSLHLQIEAMKIAFNAVETYLADPEWMTIPATDLLTEHSITGNAQRINMQQAQALPYQLPENHGTVYLSTADATGKMVSFIQSNYMGFGSGVVIPNTGISLQNRACGFSLHAGHPNQVDGGKRPLHTIIPAFVTRNGKPLMAFGVMGGRMQPQGHVQMMVRIFNYQQNPQTASDAPRWCVLEDGRLALENSMPSPLIQGLQQRGHNITTEEDMATFGGAQLILNQGDGYIAASDHRKDGQAAGF